MNTLPIGAGPTALRADAYSQEHTIMGNTSHVARLQREQQFHDKVASRITVTPGRGGWVDCEAPTWPNEPKISPSLTTRMLRLLGDVRGKRVLVYGCGYDPGPTWFARRGADVTAIDISRESINDQRILMDAYGISMHLEVADAMHTPFPGGFFDIVYGNAILHHLDSESCAQEIARLLAPEGVALFREVQAGNVFLRLFRFVTPFWRTPDEHPLTETDYSIYRRYFRNVNITAHVFTSMLYLFCHRMTVEMLRLVRIRWWPAESTRFLGWCDRIDNWLTRIPGMSSQMWFSLIEMRQ
jgi:SAM-dependent methyltransferase